MPTGIGIGREGIILSFISDRAAMEAARKGMDVEWRPVFGGWEFRGCYGVGWSLKYIVMGKGIGRLTF